MTFMTKRETDARRVAVIGAGAAGMMAAVTAAEAGAEATREMVAKYGRAKNLKEASIGHLDPGAVSVAVMIRALSDRYQAIR